MKLAPVEAFGAMAFTLGKYGVAARVLPAGLHVGRRCDKCGSLHGRDINAVQNIGNEAERMIAAGIAGTANRGAVSQVKGHKLLFLQVRSHIL